MRSAQEWTKLAIALAFACAFSAGFERSVSGQEKEAIDQATAASRHSGAPMLVIAGRETCPNCTRLVEQLRQGVLARMTRGTVPLKIDVDGSEWRQWTSQYGRPEGTLLPFVYVVRADGETIHKHSGPMESDQLAQVIGTQLQNAGRPLSDREIKSIDDAVTAAKESLDTDNPAQAVRELLKLKRIGELGQLGSYARSAVEANRLVGDMVSEVQESLQDIDQRLKTEDEQLQVCFEVARTARIYGVIPAVDQQLDPVLANIRRDRDLREVWKSATAIDRACKLCESNSTKQRGLDALQRIVEQEPDSAAAKVAARQLELLKE